MISQIPEITRSFQSLVKPALGMKAYALYSIVCAVAVSARAQGTFRNMDFESANVNQLQPPGLVNTVDAIPGWNAYLGDVLQSQIYFDKPSLGEARISLIGTQGQFGSPIEGGFGVVLQGGGSPYGQHYDDASISQFGRLPNDALSVLFKAQEPYGDLVVSVNDVSLPVLALASEGNITTIYGVDISHFSGQIVTLKFTELSTGLNTYCNLDSIVISPMGIPEPNGLSLTALGILFAGLFVKSRLAINRFLIPKMTSRSQRFNHRAANKTCDGVSMSRRGQVPPVR